MCSIWSFYSIGSFRPLWWFCLQGAKNQSDQNNIYQNPSDQNHNDQNPSDQNPCDNKSDEN